MRAIVVQAVKPCRARSTYRGRVPSHGPPVQARLRARPMHESLRKRQLFRTRQHAALRYTVATLSFKAKSGACQTRQCMPGSAHSILRRGTTLQLIAIAGVDKPKPLAQISSPNILIPECSCTRFPDLLTRCRVTVCVGLLLGWPWVLFLCRVFGVAYSLGQPAPVGRRLAVAACPACASQVLLQCNYSQGEGRATALTAGWPPTPLPSSPAPGYAGLDPGLMHASPAPTHPGPRLTASPVSLSQEQSEEGRAWDQRAGMCTGLLRARLAATTWPSQSALHLGAERRKVSGGPMARGQRLAWGTSRAGA